MACQPNSAAWRGVRVLRFLLFVFVLCSIFMLQSNTASAAETTFYVNVDAVAGGNGLSWTNALDEQGFIDKLDAASGDLANTYVFWVAKGEYRPVVPVDVDWVTSEEQNKSFWLYSNVKLYGGFAGNETALSQRNWQSNVTTLTGYLDDPDGMWPTQSQHVVVISGDGNQALLDGFTVTGGYTNWSPVFDDEIGGGVIIIGASPTIQNCTFRGNEAVSAGGAIANTMPDHLEQSRSSSVKIINCVFEENRSEFLSSTSSGGAIVNALFDADPVDPITITMGMLLQSCDFRENSAAKYGGAIQNGHEWSYVYNTESILNLKVEGCLFEANIVSSDCGTGGGGAIANVGTGFTKTNLDISASRFLENRAVAIDDTCGEIAAYGGAILNGVTCDMCSIFYETAINVNIADTSFEENTASACGGAIFSGGWYGSLANLVIQLDVDSSTFKSNVSGNNGGAITNSNTFASIVNSTFYGNQAAGSGGAIAGAQAGGDCISSCGSSGMSPDLYVNVLLVNNTISGNTSVSGGAGYMAGPSTNALLVNNIFWNNSGPAEIGAISSDVELQKTIVQNDSFYTSDEANVVKTSVLTDNPVLSALADNGGLTQTMAISGSGAAVKNGLPINSALSGSLGGLGMFSVTAVPNVDQRDAARAGNADIGAYEVTATPPSPDPDDCEGDCGSGCGVLPGAFAALAIMGLPFVVMATRKKRA